MTNQPLIRYLPRAFRTIQPHCSMIGAIGNSQAFSISIDSFAPYS
ncbi:hypothetical protein CEV31_0580 [Brucella thiophenivorans]|uniref:Uncharacterized protein n=1 Tax=Brucella thiophenivorans TaxID=571255 RepID=A0A256G4Y6_9HYPH|nr:hypothetical protein CEV31_0580 [Brucella thiophenivorans]